jgi:hypothetical protein
MIRKYQNELIVLVAFIFLLGGFLYQKRMSSLLDSSLNLSKTAATQITETKTLQNVWTTKGLKQKVAELQGKLLPMKTKQFEQKKGKLSANFVELTGQELNMISTKIASLPVHIEKLIINRSGDKYAMECQCSW